MAAILSQPQCVQQTQFQRGQEVLCRVCLLTVITHYGMWCGHHLQGYWATGANGPQDQVTPSIIYLYSSKKFDTPCIGVHLESWLGFGGSVAL